MNAPKSVAALREPILPPSAIVPSKEVWTSAAHWALGIISWKSRLLREIFDPEAAAAMGLREGGICVMIHSGSRGLGYQVCDDALRLFRNTPEKYGITLPDRQLACAWSTAEGQKYLAGMRGDQLCLGKSAASDVAYSRGLQDFFGRPWEELR